MQISNYIAQLTGKSIEELFYRSPKLVQLEQDAAGVISIVYWDDSLTSSQPSAEDIAAALEAPEVPTVSDYQAAIQRLVDQTAVEKQFNDGVTLASYVNSTIKAWSGQAKAFVAWRDAVWSYAYAELAKVEDGSRTQPTVPDFLAELPVLAWPL